MSTGSALYLIMCVTAFAIFGLVLAYCSYQQSKLGRDYISAPVKTAAEPEAELAKAA